MAVALEWNHFIETMSTSLGLESAEIQKGTHLYNEIGIDSLGIFSLGIKLIEVYGIKIPLSSVATIQTVEDMYNIMDEYRNANN